MLSKRGTTLPQHKNLITTNFAYRLLPSLSSSFAKRPLTYNASVDDELSTVDKELGCRDIEVNREG